MRVIYKTIRERLEEICSENTEQIRHIELTKDEHRELIDACGTHSDLDYQANVFMGVKIVVGPGGAG